MWKHKRCQVMVNILQGRTIVAPLPAVARDAPLERANQADGRMIRGFKPGSHFLKEGRIKFYRATCRSNGLCSFGRNQAKFSLRFGQRSQDFQPGTRARYLIEKLTQFGCTP